MKTNSKKILFIDMDGVCADFAHGIKMLTGRDIHPHEEHEWVYEACKSSPNIFYHLPPIKGAIKSVEVLWDKFEIYFLSTAMWGVPESFTDKRLWIEKHFGEKAADRLILTRRKDLCVGHYLIDDRIKNGVDKFTGKHIHFGTEQFADWRPVLNFLMKEAEAKHWHNQAFYD